MIGWVNIGDLLISAQDERAATTPLAEAVAVAPRRWTVSAASV